MQQVFVPIASVAEYLQTVADFKHIKGFLHDLEGFTLMTLAAQGPAQGAIVEIGSLYGKSTCWLARGALKAGREQVTAIDHFKGSPEHQDGQVFAQEDLQEKGSTFFTFMENIRSAGLEKQVRPVAASSLDAAKTWSGPVRLLFIDGEHSYEAVSADFKAWSPFLVPGGVVAFHDIQWEGPGRFYQELLDGGGYADFLRLSNMGVVRKAE